MNLLEPADELIFFDWMDMFPPSKKLQATMCLKGGTPAKDRIKDRHKLSLYACPWTFKQYIPNRLPSLEH